MRPLSNMRPPRPGGTGGSSSGSAPNYIFNKRRDKFLYFSTQDQAREAYSGHSGVINPLTCCPLNWTIAIEKVEYQPH